jgi:hypothetical protein
VPVSEEKGQVDASVLVAFLEFEVIRLVEEMA